MWPTAGLEDVVRPSGEPEAVRIGLLGGFRVSVGPRIIEGNQWRLRKASGLVKLLALSPGHHLHREQAMEALWPDLGRRAAANNVRGALHAARRTLHPSPEVASRYLVSRGERIALCPERQLWVDVEAFEEAAATARRSQDPAAYRAAIELYAGELLPEDRYEEWAEVRRGELRRSFLSLLIELAALYEERREHGLAIETLRRVTGEEPANEDSHAALMRLHTLLGRPAEALQQYERLREALSDELGVEPGAASKRLREEIAAGGAPAARLSSTGLPPEKPPGAHQHNLPAALTSFVGREQQLVELKRELAMTRLLTLTGAGGCGKTRLALEVAKDLVGAYPDGVWLVELVGLSEPPLVVQTVAMALGVQEQPNRLLADTLVEALRGKNMLLVLDNCEHLIDTAAHLVDVLLTACPHLRILATSREALGVAGETNWRVPSLSAPDVRQPITVEQLEGYESARLFVERARRRSPAFVPSPSNAHAVAEICRKLEGIPLAIELAAGRVKVLSAEQIAQRLEDSLKLLSAGDRTAPPRHRTLGRTLDWSYELLPELERRLFERLSAFAGGWTLEAAEVVGAGEDIERGDVLDLLSRLLDKSLVATESGERTVLRYGMLEPVRQYARERLEASGKAEEVRCQHASFYLELAKEAEPKLIGPQQRLWLDRLEREHDNLRAVLSWSLECGDDLGLRMAGALWRFWYARGYLSEGQRWLEEVLARSGSAPALVQAKAFRGLGWLAEAQGDHERASAAYEKSLRIYRSAADEAGVAASLGGLGSVALSQGDHERATALLEESVTLLWKSRKERDVASVLNTLGALASYKGDQARAMSFFEEALKLSRKAGDVQAIAVSLSNLGLTKLLHDDPERSTALLEESLALFREVGDDLDIAICLTNLALAALLEGDHERVTGLVVEGLGLIQKAGDKQRVADCLERMAGVAGARGQAPRAARLWGAAQALREEMGVPLPVDERKVLEPYLAAARSQLEKGSWEAALIEGRAMTAERAVEYALSGEQEARTTTSGPKESLASEKWAGLSRREREIALLVARGLTNRRIASKLVISERTVEHHVANILRKLDLRSRAQIT
jgi:predicted ATPase/DNA-binding SARP family transcriptional activator/DNA-binding CsgD family transcriptional regulator